MKHYIKDSNSTLENQSILIMDNHKSHLSIESLDLANASDVIVLTLLPHISAKMQLLDVSTFEPFKKLLSCCHGFMVDAKNLYICIYKYMPRISENGNGVPFDRYKFNDVDSLPRPNAGVQYDALPVEENQDAEVFHKYPDRMNLAASTSTCSSENCQILTPD